MPEDWKKRLIFKLLYYCWLYREYDEKMGEWVNEMKKLLPINFRFSGLPMFFNYYQPEKIRSLIIENAESFYLVI